MWFLVSASLILASTVPQTIPAPPPDFSGTWTVDRSRSQSPDIITLDIKQTATEIGIDTTRSGVRSSETYPFETTKHPEGQTIPVGHAHAYWDGTKLVTETSRNISGQTVSYKQTRSLNAAGTEMTVETITIVQHGYTITGGQNYGTAKDVYVRAK
jgi:hypothetical protein